ncbi:MAG: Hedgehog/intein hint domain protein, partial [Bacteroidetes bacterium]|nr:Hedgehog/intein hint domain protein [Bacteroidota bacterium]
MRTLLLLYFCFGWIYTAFAQSRPIRTDEYDRAKTFTVKDLDNDTYVKFNNAYVLDRYEMRKPYIITGDDGLKKRIDLYRLVAKDSMMDIGTVIFYTNEKGTLYTAVLPLFNSNPEIWNKYFEDIHAIDKVEKNYVLKLSYVLSREFSFQLYKSMNG